MRSPVLVIAEVFDAAQRDLLVVIVAFPGPGGQVAEGAAPADGDFLQVREGHRGVVVHGPLDEVFQALGRYWHATSVTWPWRWRCRFLARGTPVRGYPLRLAVLAVATSVPPDGESQWSPCMIASHLHERDLAISPATVGRVLAEAKVRPHKVRGWLNRADDPAFWLRAGAVCRLYPNPPPGAVLISIDEKTGIQAKSRKHPQIPARPGRDTLREFEYVRHGTISIIAAMNVTTGEVITERIDKNDSAAFTGFLAMLHQMIRFCLRIHLICDNGSSHTSAATRAWLAAHPRFQVTYTPKHASWLNMVEQWFGVLTRRLLRRGDFASRDDLEAKITAFTIRHNRHARPYNWSYDADADHARYLERHRQPEPVPALAEAA